MKTSKGKPVFGVRGFRLYGPPGEEGKRDVPKRAMDIFSTKRAAPEREKSFAERQPDVDANRWFHVQAMWGYVNRVKNSGEYRGDAFIVDTETLPPQDINQQVDEISKFFGIDSSEFGDLDAKGALERVIKPFLRNVERSINYLRPPNITGRITFELDENGSLVLVYQDR